MNEMMRKDMDHKRRYLIDTYQKEIEERIKNKKQRRNEINQNQR
jgi:hypothetical protein